MKPRFVILGTMLVLMLVLSAAVKRPGNISAAHVETEQAARASGPPTPVLVELFTSEGCSDCPPADALLSRLAATQPVLGAEVIALEHHVDYWDQQGWRDPFSSAAATDRQNGYALSFGLPTSYTPQMIVDGGAEFVGSDQSKAFAAIAAAAQPPKSAIEHSFVTDQSRSSDSRPVLDIRLRSLPDNPKAGSADVFLAVTEDNLHSNVRAGENNGHALDHTGVVRRFDRIGSVQRIKDLPSGAGGKDAFTSRQIISVARDWKPDHLHAVVFVQESHSRHVLAAGSITFPASHQ